METDHEDNTESGTLLGISEGYDSEENDEKPYRSNTLDAVAEDSMKLDVVITTTKKNIWV